MSPPAFRLTGRGSLPTPRLGFRLLPVEITESSVVLVRAEPAGGERRLVIAIHRIIRVEVLVRGLRIEVLIGLDRGRALAAADLTGLADLLSGAARAVRVVHHRRDHPDDDLAVAVAAAARLVTGRNLAGGRHDHLPYSLETGGGGTFT